MSLVLSDVIFSKTSVVVRMSLSVITFVVSVVLGVVLAEKELKISY